jgi:hypothetical protein
MIVQWCCRGVEGVKRADVEVILGGGVGLKCR